MNMQENVASLLSFFLLLHLLDKSNAVGPCVYDPNPKGIIDLSSVGRQDGTPMWRNADPDMSDGHVYSYNPCHPFNQGSCIDVAACQTFKTDETLTYSLGTQNSIQWNIATGQDLPTLTYTSGERTLHVNLICLNAGEANRLEVYGHDDATNSYIMVLSSPCACWDGCKGGPGPGPGPDPGPKPGNGISGGTIIIILLVALLIVYLVGFMSYNKFKRQATGLDILPHRGFWASLPGYSFDGVRFVFRKVTGKSGYSTVG